MMLLRGADSRQETVTQTAYPLWFLSEPAVGIETCIGEERKGEEDVRTSSNCLQFRPLGRGGLHWLK